MDYRKERQEAIAAGEKALYSLQEARRHLSGAKGFGLWDILGGGKFVSFAKHLKIEKARRILQTACYDLQNFNTELNDISMNLNIDIGPILTFFDLYDNIIADIMVQSRLSSAIYNIDYAINTVQTILRQL